MPPAAVFLGKDAASGVDDMAAGLEIGHGLFENLPLFCNEALEHLFFEFPFHVGLRRKVPVPVQGASTSTQSIFSFMVFLLGESKGRGWAFWMPARLSRFLASRMQTGGCRVRISCPLPCHSGAMASDLPPDPAQ